MGPLGGLDCRAAPMDLETLYREERPRALATLIRLLRDFDLASADEIRSEWSELAEGKPVFVARMHLVRKAR